MPTACPSCCKPFPAHGGPCERSDCPRRAGRSPFDQPTIAPLGNGAPPAPGVFELATVATAGTPRYILGAETPRTGVPLSLDLPGYEVRRLIGQGGMGLVLEARQLSLDRTVAIKVLAPELAGNPQFVERFEREATALARLAHPHIVAIYERGHHAGLLYFVMEHVEGPAGEPGDLRRLLDQGLPDLSTTRRLILQIVQALAYAHGHGVIHRDIKPSNVLLDRRGNARVTDFGIAVLGGALAQASPALTQFGAKLGTFGYMAPEQYRDPTRVDARADVYSTGVLLYEMLTGQLPAGAYAPPSQAVPGLSGGWDGLIARAIAQDPQGRFADMDQFAAALHALESVAAPGGEGLRCPSCGAAAGLEDRFCGRCRLLLRAACPRCREEIRLGVRYCPVCGLDVPAFQVYDRERQRGLLHLQQARAPGSLGERCRAAGVAHEAFRTALEAAPDEQVRLLAVESRVLLLSLLAETAGEALGRQQYGEAGALSEQLLRLEPSHPQAARALEEVRQVRKAGLEEVRGHLGGAPARAVPLLARLQEQFPEDAEIAALAQQARQQSDLAVDAVGRLAAHKEQKQYSAMRELLLLLQAEEVPLSGVQETLAQVEGRLERVRPDAEAAQAALDAGRLAEARALAAKVLRRVSDHPQALAIVDQAGRRGGRLEEALAEVGDALAEGRWFHARALIGAFVAEGLPAQAFKAVRASAEVGCARANDFARLLVWGVFGAVAWLVSGGLAAQVVSQLGVRLPSVRSLSGQAPERLLILVGQLAFGTLLLGLLLVLLRRRPTWRALLWPGILLGAVAGAVVLDLLGAALVLPADWLAQVRPGLHGLPRLLQAEVVLLFTGLLGLALGHVCAEQTAHLVTGPRRADRHVHLVALGVLALWAGVALRACPHARHFAPAGLALCGLLAVTGVSGLGVRYFTVAVAGLIATGVATVAAWVGRGFPSVLYVGAALMFTGGAFAANGDGWRGLAPHLRFRLGRDLPLTFLLAGGALLLFALLPADSDLALLIPAWLVVVGSVAAQNQDTLDPRLHLRDRLDCWSAGEKVPESAELPAPEEPRAFAWHLLALALLPLGIPILAVGGIGLKLVNVPQAAALGVTAGLVVLALCQVVLFVQPLPRVLRVLVAVLLNWVGYAIVLGVLLSKAPPEDVPNLWQVVSRRSP
jgi:hypothetical protein